MVFRYRGKSEEELKKLSLEEFAQLLPSRARRSLRRQLPAVQKFLKQCEQKLKKGKPIKTHLRHLVIVPQLLGLELKIHNGKAWTSVRIVPEMLGHRLGEFALTRARVKHGRPGIGATRSSAYLSVK